MEEEYRKWKTMNNENDILKHFSQGTPPLFLCLLWKMLLENDRINPIAYKILDRIGARAFSAHIRLEFLNKHYHCSTFFFNFSQNIC